MSYNLLCQVNAKDGGAARPSVFSKSAVCNNNIMSSWRRAEISYIVEDREDDDI